MPTIDSLPIELIHRIISLGEQSFDVAGPASDWHHEEPRRRRYLLTLCLVQRRWAIPAREAVWRRLTINGDNQAQRCLQSSEINRAQCLHLHVYAVHAGCFTALLDKLRPTITSLTLTVVSGLLVEHLTHNTLTKLKHMQLETSAARSNAAQSTPLPFALESFRINAVYHIEGNAPDLISSLFDASQHSLRHFSWLPNSGNEPIHPIGPHPTKIDIMDNLSTVSSFLRSFAIAWRVPEAFPPRDLVFTGLERLCLFSATGADRALEPVKTPLAYLEIGRGGTGLDHYEDERLDLVTVVDWATTPALDNKSTLALLHHSRAGLMKTEQGKAFLDVLNGRGVEVLLLGPDEEASFSEDEDEED